MAKKTKLELTWIGKDQRPRLEPRVLLEDPEKSYHAPHKVTENDQFDNRLIFGDNLLALKALEQEFAGKIKCIYIDPPYNTGSAFSHYDDGVEHSLWLSLLKDRLELLQRLLSSDGVIFVQIDDNEQPYLRVVMDEVFGRSQFLGTIVWQKRVSPDSDSKFLSATHDYILAYAKDYSTGIMNRLPRTAVQDARYKNPDADSRGPWTSSDLTRREYREHDYYAIALPSGREVWPAQGRSWSVPKESYDRLVNDNRIYFGANGNSMPRRKRFLSEVREGVVPTTWWDGDNFGRNEDGKREVNSLFPDNPDVFATPKPEKLISQLLTLGSSEGDWVLDSFAGSGTTGAVAHKMGRKWIMVELGDHCDTHIIPRLKKVLDGEDSGGITESVNWKGGGGFRYFSLAPSLLEQDEFGNWIISKQYNATMLARAICKIEGFTYAPSESVYWQQGHSTETDFIYVTTQNLTRQQIEALAEEVGPNRSLSVMCSAYRIRKVDDFPNLTLKKIPKTVLNKCEWGKDDYSLEIQELPPAPADNTETGEPSEPPPPRRRKPRNDEGQPRLFAMEGEQ